MVQGLLEATGNSETQRLNAEVADVAAAHMAIASKIHEMNRLSEEHKSKADQVLEKRLKFIEERHKKRQVTLDENVESSFDDWLLL